MASHSRVIQLNKICFIIKLHTPHGFTCVAYLFGAEDVVRRDAGLTHVEHLAPEDAASRDVQVDLLVDVARAGKETTYLTM